MAKKKKRIKFKVLQDDISAGALANSIETWWNDSHNWNIRIERYNYLKEVDK